MAYMRIARRAKHEAARAEAQTQAAKPLQEAWNGERLRCGDMVGEPSSTQRSLHPNTYSLKSVLRAAWLQIGKLRLL